MKPVTSSFDMNITLLIQRNVIPTFENAHPEGSCVLDVLQEVDVFFHTEGCTISGDGREKNWLKSIYPGILNVRLYAPTAMTSLSYQTLKGFPYEVLQP